MVTLLAFNIVESSLICSAQVVFSNSFLPSPQHLVLSLNALSQVHPAPWSGGALQQASCTTLTLPGALLPRPMQTQVHPRTSSSPEWGAPAAGLMHLDNPSQCAFQLYQRCYWSSFSNPHDFIHTV